MPPTHATYVYCVLRSVRKPGVPRGETGVPGSPRPGVIPVAADLWLVATAVPLDRYGPGALERALRDLEWVGTVAVGHQAVVEQFSKQRGTTVIPMKLFTLFSTAGRAAAEMRRRSRQLAPIFDHIEGCEEWGVRVTRGPSQAAPPRRSSAPSTGVAFLEARRRARQDLSQGLRKVADAADTAFDVLSQVARDRRRTPGAAAGPRPLLEAAFLIPARRRAAFHASADRAARDVARSGGVLTLTGPWPAYTFVGPAGQDPL